MEELTDMLIRQNLDQEENMIQLIDLPEIFETVPPVISFYSPEVMAVEDDDDDELKQVDDELKQVDQFHGKELEKPRNLISCGDKSSRSSSIDQEGSRCKTSNIMAVLENDESNPDYTRSINRTTKSWSANGGWWMTEHLLFDILILLPVATLLRFKSVCKSWCALISSSNFIAQHLDRDFGKENIIGFHYPEPCIPFERMSYKFCLLSGNKYEDYRSFDCEKFVVEDHRELHRFSSDGIVCIVPRYRDGEVDLWNPAMKQLRRLPESEQLRRFPRPSGPNDYFVSYGSGYSVRSNDYKVVRTFVHMRNAGKNVVEVYSLKANSWRTILEDGVLSFKSIIRPVSRNGTCFWVGSNYTKVSEHCCYDWNVVSFDFNDETFETMPLPEYKSDYSVLDFLGDKLACISGVTIPNLAILGCRYYEIWVLHEYGVKESWSKIWKIGPSVIPCTDDVYSPIGFSTNGDYLLLTDDDNNIGGGGVYMYNLGTQENEYIQLRPLDREVCLFVRCMESLVPVKRMKAAY